MKHSSLRNHYRTTATASSLVVLMTTLAAPMAFAQAAPGAADEAVGLEEIVVTAQKRSESINDVGITINAFTAQSLDNYGVRSMEDMAALTPGLTITSTASTGVPVYTIRGVGFTDYSTAASSTVGIYFDEVAIPYAVMTRGIFFDVERVEVLKGPQGDLYGRNTTAGQINFISRKPTTEFEAGVTGEYSRFSTFDIEGYVSGPISDTVRARLAVKGTQSSKGWQKSLSRPGDTLGEKDVWALRAIVDWDITPDATLSVKAHWMKDQSDNVAPTAYDGTIIGLGTAARPSEGTPPYSTGDNRAADWSPGEYKPQRDNTMKGVSARLNWDFDTVTLTSLTAYDKFDRTEANDWDGWALNDSNNINVTDIESFSQELRLSSRDDGPLTWIVGAYYSWDKMHEEYNYFMQESFFSLALGIDTLDTRYKQKTESLAGFAHVEWKFADDWKLTLGARYTEEDRKWSGCTYDSGDGTLANALNNIIVPAMILPNGLPNPGLAVAGGCGTYDDIAGSPTFGTYAGLTDKISTNKWMWKAGIDYKVNEDTLLYLTVSSGFKSGGFNGANSNTSQQLQPYGPEKLLSVEGGIKATLLDGAMQLNLSTFWYDYKDKQEQSLAVTFVGNIGGLTNVPKSEIKGAELEMRWRATKELTFDFGAAYLDTKIKKWMAVSDTSDYPTIDYEDASGESLSNSPKWQLNGTATYDRPITDTLNLLVGVDGSFMDDKPDTVYPYKATESYFLANARIGIHDADDKWAATVWMRNVFDKDYYTSAFLGGNGPYVRVNGMPRTWGIKLDYKF